MTAQILKKMVCKSTASLGREVATQFIIVKLAVRPDAACGDKVESIALGGS